MQKLIAVLLGLGILVSGGRGFAQQPVPDVPNEELPPGSEVLTRGPVHEAFAKPVTMDYEAPETVGKEPPGQLQEMPPTEKPAGDYSWVPGYWAWDEERNDFIWVSGCWRNAPPNTYWVPGYWMRSGTGWQWIAGFWKPYTTETQEQIEYLPEPPASFDVEPPRAAYGDQVWVPGCWYWVDGRYVRRPGYWITPRVGWVWVPSYYTWSPRGYVFCRGHWDYDLDSRGVLFTPAYFPPTVRVRAGFVFSPGISVDLGALRVNLFAYPRYHHYCFGDYYDASYVRIGIYPWYRCQTTRIWYDPLFHYDRWHYRGSRPNWARDQAREFERRRDNRDLRPAHTYTEFRTQRERQPVDQRGGRPLVEPVRTVAESRTTPVKFERIDSNQRKQFASKATEVQSFRQQRNQWEGARADARNEAQPVPRNITQPPPPVSTQPPTTTQPDSRDRKQPRETKQPETRQPQPETRQPETKQPPPTQPQSPAAKQPPGRTREPLTSPRNQPQPGDRRNDRGNRVEPQPQSPNVQPRPSTEPKSTPAPRVQPQPQPETKPAPTPKVSPTPTQPDRKGPPATTPRNEPAPRVEPPRKGQERAAAPRAPEVRAKQPEQVTVPNPPITKPGNVGREAPGRPPQETYRPSAPQGSKPSPGKGKGSERREGRDR